MAAIEEEKKKLEAPAGNFWNTVRSQPRNQGWSQFWMKFNSTHELKFYFELNVTRVYTKH
jgi:hypothetical protein